MIIATGILILLVVFRLGYGAGKEHERTMHRARVVWSNSAVTKYNDDGSTTDTAVIFYIDGTYEECKIVKCK